MVAHDLADSSFGIFMSFLIKCLAHAYFAWTMFCSNQQNPGAATFRDDSFGRWDVDQATSVEWKMHRVYSLSNIAES